jgi:hypothetical protein
MRVRSLWLYVLILYHQGRPAAWVTSGRVELYPRVAVLEPEHPTRRWVLCSAIFAMEVLAGRMPGSFSQERADYFARCALIPDDEFAEVIAAEDAALAEYFNVPLEQVCEKRIDELLLRASGRTG